MYYTSKYCFNHPLQYMDIPSTSKLSQIRGRILGFTPRRPPPPRQLHALHFRVALGLVPSSLVDFHPGFVRSRRALSPRKVRIFRFFRERRPHGSETRTRGLRYRSRVDFPATNIATGKQEIDYSYTFMLLPGAQIKLLTRSACNYFAISAI